MLDYYNVDGIDLDIEGNVVTENYSQIIVELSKVLKNNGYGLTGAFNYYSGRKISDEAINCFDMINVMSYNESGLWEPHLRDHSTFEDSQKHLNYWVETRKIAPEKIVLGVPFYGWFKTFDLDDNLLNQGSITYDKISNFFPYIDNSNDWLELQTKNSKTEITFNNIDAIKNKRLLAREYGGIMIWQYIQDTKERTLFNTIINN